ncbi:MAG: divergent PAP2 family protein [Chloroflexota bacterium]|nr:divergent PAP2 family protein [Dehalococcoidia bacterium]MDW8253665.1 divergent PAP2 family protein [Chloroflexota bacterium]
MEALLANKYLTIPFFAWLLSQSIKVLWILIREHRLSPRTFTRPGGMPSAHSAVVMSLATVIGKLDGVHTPLFALSLVFAAIVMYDAAGVRRAVGIQAGILNRMLDEYFVEHRFSEKRLFELIGHTPIQVVAGALLGFTLAWVWA